MKNKFFAFFVFFVIIINMFLPFSVFASEKITVFNCNEEVGSFEGTSLSDVYIPVSYLHRIEIETIDMGESLCLYTNSKKALVYKNSSIVKIEDISLTFNNAVSNKNN